MCEVFGASQQALPPPQARAAWAALWTALSQHPAAVISTQQQSAGASGPRKCPQRPGSGLGVVSASVFYLEKNSRFLQWCQSKEKREHSGVPLLTSYPTCPVLAGRPRPVSCVWCLCPHTGRPLGRPSSGFCVARLQRAGRTRAPVTFSWDLSWSLSFGLDVSTDASAESSEMSVLKKTALPSSRASLVLGLVSSWLTEVCPGATWALCSPVWRQQWPLLGGRGVAASRRMISAFDLRSGRPGRP